MVKKILSILVLLSLVFSMITVSASEVASGTCGYDLTWSLNEDGVLTISGTGDMFHYTYAEKPWLGWDIDITSIVIRSGVTSIGDYAFDNGSQTSVTIPSTVDRIGNFAFAQCLFIESIVIPEGVQSIGVGSFEGSWLTGVTLPESLLVIEDNAFNGCSELTSVEIPGSVERIGEHAFAGCNLASVIINEGVKTIDVAAFARCYPLESIVIPNGVKNIGIGAFEDCDLLADITLPDSVDYIGEYAFYNTAFYNDDSNWKNKVLYIDNHLIQAKEDISGHYSIKEGTKTIAAAAFWSLYALSGITIPLGVKNINNDAFSDTGITELNLPTSLVNIGKDAFHGLEITSLEIPGSVKVIGDYAFSKCGYLTDVKIPDGVKYIGTNAFGDSWGIWPEETLQKQNHVLYIDNHLIYCSAYYEGSYSIPEGTKTLSANSFAGSGWADAFTGVTIPSSVTAIHKNTFDSCTQLEDITIPSSIKAVGKNAFYNTKVYNNEAKWDDGVLYIQNCLIEAVETATGKQNVKSGTRVIADEAFINRTHITEVVLPDSITDIGEGAFSGCSNLESVTIPVGIENINDFAFTKCKSLKNVYFGGSQSEWEEIKIGDGNEWLKVADVNFAKEDTNTETDSVTFDAEQQKAIVDVLEGGTYTLIFADYNGTMLNKVQMFTQPFSLGENRVSAPFALDTGDKIMVWKNLNNIMPLCNAYVIK